MAVLAAQASAVMPLLCLVSKWMARNQRAREWFGADHRWSIEKALSLTKVFINQYIDVNFPVRYCPQQSYVGCLRHA